MKCCKEHKESCPALIKGTFDTDTDSKSCLQTSKSNTTEGTEMKSEYVSSDALSADPIENAIRRRKMLDDNESDDDSVDEHGWGITKEMMDRLDNSKWLRKELADGGLRQMIATIDNADWEKEVEKKKRKRNQINQIHELTPRETALERAKYSNPKFANFVDKLLLTAGVLVENKKGADDDVDIASLLTNCIDSNNLSLASIPCKRKLNIEKKDDDENDSFSSSDNESDAHSET